MISYRLFRLILLIFVLLMGMACQFMGSKTDNDNDVTSISDKNNLSELTPSVASQTKLSVGSEERPVSLNQDEAISLETKEVLIEWLQHVGMEREPTEVQRILLDAGWIAEAQDWQQVELDGDAQAEGVLTLIEKPTVEFDDRLSWRSVLIIDDELMTFEGFSERQTLYRVLSTDDLTGDELADIVVESATYGANYYPLTYHVLSAHHGSLQSIVQPPPNVNDSYSFEEGQFIAMGVDVWEDAHFLDVTQDGLQDIVLRGIAGGGAGGGISRSYQAVWAWDGEAMTLADVAWQANKYRFHKLYNAYEAFEKGDDKTAYLLYHHVLFDELLSDEVSSSCIYDQENERCTREPWAAPQELYEINRQLAAFHLTLLALLRAEREGNKKTWRGEAKYWRDWLHQYYPNAPLSEASEVLLAEWDATEDLTGSCQAVRAYLDQENEQNEQDGQDQQDKAVLGPLINMGYNNPSLTIEQLCIIPPQKSEPTTEKSALVSELEEIILPTLLSGTPQQGYMAGNEQLNIMPLQVDKQQAPLWAVFTTGSVGDYPTLEHMLAIYTRDDEGWQDVASVTFSEPNYIDTSSIRQIQVSPDYIWLELYGGVGGNSSQYKVLRFDGEQLHVEIDHFSSRHGGFDLSPIDLDEDGMLELILEPLQNYVFCQRECDVRYYKYLVLRWNGDAFAEVPLTTLHPSTPAALRDLNDRAVELAKAGLWKDALTTIREARAIDYTARNPYVTWNELLINLHAEAMFRHSLDNRANNYPLLANILYGDYDNALHMMRRYPVEKLFDPKCPLISNTLVQGWQEELNDWIKKTTEKALAVQPDLAAAYFLRAWSSYLLDPSNKEILLDLERAVELAPNEALFMKGLEYLKLMK